MAEALGVAAGPTPVAVALEDFAAFAGSLAPALGASVPNVDETEGSEAFGPLPFNRSDPHLPQAEASEKPQILRR